MGAWGPGPFENDDGAEIKEIVEEFVAPLLQTWDPEKLLRFFTDVYFNGRLPNATDGTNDRLIAIGALFTELGHELPPPLHIHVSQAVSWELQKPALEEWGRSKAKRKKALTSFAQEANLNLNTEPEPSQESPYTAEIRSLRRWFDNMDELNEIRNNISSKRADFFESLRPKFWKHLDDNTWEMFLLDESVDKDEVAELSELRFLCALWWAMFNLGYDNETIKQELERKRS